MTYQIKGRYGISCTLRQESRNRWKLRVKSGMCRFGLTPDHESLSFVDPDGGPFIDVGSSLNRYCRDLPDTKIVKIVHTKGRGITLHTTEPDEAAA